MPDCWLLAANPLHIIKQNAVDNVIKNPQSTVPPLLLLVVSLSPLMAPHRKAQVWLELEGGTLERRHGGGPGRRTPAVPTGPAAWSREASALAAWLTHTSAASVNDDLQEGL